MRNLFLTFLLVFLTPTLAIAEEHKGYAVVDIQELMRGSDAALSVQAQVDDIRNDLREDFSAREKSLQKTEQDLIAKKDTLDAADFEVARREFEKELVATQALAQKKRQEIDAAVNGAMSKLRDKIFEIVADHAEKQGFSLVITRQNVVLVEKSLDITNIVMQKLNDSVNHIDVKIAE